MNIGVFFRVMLVFIVSSFVVSGCKRPPKGDESASMLSDDFLPGGVSTLDSYEGDSYGMEGERFADGGRVAGDHEPIYFAYDSSQITPGERYKADSIADVLQGSQEIRLVVAGHCDERGSREYNLALGERRALSVRQYLIESGIESDRIQTKSFGEEMPVEIGHDGESHRLNRRAEFELLKP